MCRCPGVDKRRRRAPLLESQTTRFLSDDQRRLRTARLGPSQHGGGVELDPQRVGVGQKLALGGEEGASGHVLSGFGALMPAHDDGGGAAALWPGSSGCGTPASSRRPRSGHASAEAKHRANAPSLHDRMGAPSLAAMLEAG